MQDGRRTVDDEGRQPIAIGHLSDSGDQTIPLDARGFGGGHVLEVYSHRLTISSQTRFTGQSLSNSRL